MYKFAEFVDGSNLYGSLRAMNLEVIDYEKLFSFLFDEAVQLWTEKTRIHGQVPTQLHRIYWYVVGKIDNWDLSQFQAQAALKSAYLKDRDTKEYWRQYAKQKNTQGKDLETLAWEACFANFQSWYNAKVDSLEKMKGFYQAVRSSTDLIDIIECGHWKVNFLRKYVEEKGLDTSIAVDLVALQDNYDVAVLISGDADAIPSIAHAKAKGKHVISVEFINGTPEDEKSRSFSSRLKEHADLVLRVHESELLKHKLVKRYSGKAK